MFAKCVCRNEKFTKYKPSSKESKKNFLGYGTPVSYIVYLRLPFYPSAYSW